MTRLHGHAFYLLRASSTKILEDAINGQDDACQPPVTNAT